METHEQELPVPRRQSRRQQRGDDDRAMSVVHTEAPARRSARNSARYFARETVRNTAARNTTTRDTTVSSS
eukprot:3523170-Pleurochrysis_carterae.AAC.1